MTDELMNLDLLNPSATPKASRILSIDRLRGLCMFCMVFSFLLSVFADINSFDGAFALKIIKICSHGDSGLMVLPGVSLADLFAPTFIFVVGLTMVMSFKSRERKVGTGRAYFQIAVRFLGLIGIGCLLNSVEEGWKQYFMEDKLFHEIEKNMQIFMVGFFVAVGLIGISVLAGFTKCDKFKKLANSTLRYLLAVMGLFSVYFLLVSTGERVGHLPNVYGGAIWDTLQNIGLAGLFALPFVKLGTSGRLVVVLVTFAAVSVFYKYGGQGLGQEIIEGGIFGAFGWGGIVLLGTVFADLKDSKYYWVLTSVLLLVSVIMIFAWNYQPFKRGCSPTYAMFAAGVSAMVWGFLNFFNHRRTKFAFFTWWGGSAILTYVINYLFFNLLLVFSFEKNATTFTSGEAFTIMLTILLFFTLMNWLLHRFNKHVRI